MEYKFEPITISYKMPSITYVASDGTRFIGERIKYRAYENKLTKLRMEWYNKRFSIKGELMYFLFKIEPKKPYNF
jgi:hypothetical protein